MNVECCVCLERDGPGQVWGAWPCGHVVRNVIRRRRRREERSALRFPARPNSHAPVLVLTITITITVVAITVTQMCMRCIHGVFRQEYDEDDPAKNRRTREVCNNPANCPMCKQKTRLRKVVRLYTQDRSDADAAMGGEGGQTDDDDDDDDEQDASNNSSKARIKELNAMLTSTRRRFQEENKEKLRLAQANEDLAGQVAEMAATSKRRLDATRKERDDALRERKMYEKKAANLQVEVDRLRQEVEWQRSYASRVAVALDDKLVGERLTRKLQDTGENSRDWVHETLEARNRKILSLTNEIERLEREMNRLAEEQARAREAREGREARDNLVVLSGIENVPAPARKRTEGGVGRRNLPSAASKVAKRDGNSKRPAVAMNDDVELLEKDVVVLLDDEDGEAVVVGSRSKAVTSAFARAGPSRDTLHAAPGPSFITRSALDNNKASTGLDDPGTFIRRLPDGRGGWATAAGLGGPGRGRGGVGGRGGGRKNAEISSFFQKR